MRTRQSQALILEVVDLHDKDRIVAFLTPEFGLKRGVARGARTKYSRFAGHLLQLAKVEIRWFEKAGRDLVRIEEVSMLRPPGPMHEQLEGLLLSAYLAEHVGQFAQENEESSRLYRLLDSTIEALDQGIEPGLAARYFETWVLRLAGIFPTPEDCPSCGGSLFADEEQGRRARALLPRGAEALVCGDCARGRDGIPADDDVLVFLRASSQKSLSWMARQELSKQTLQQVELLCAEIRRNFLGKELRSYKVMQRTLMEVGR